MGDALKVTYYGHVFDASGYGEAARAYIHALHGAGVSLSVVDLLHHGGEFALLSLHHALAGDGDVQVDPHPGG